MSADIHSIASGTEPDDSSAEEAPISGERSVYLDAYLAPFRRWLDRDTVTEIMVNADDAIFVDNPGEIHFRDHLDDSRTANATDTDAGAFFGEFRFVRPGFATDNAKRGSRVSGSITSKMK